MDFYLVQFHYTIDHYNEFYNYINNTYKKLLPKSVLNTDREIRIINDFSKRLSLCNLNLVFNKWWIKFKSDDRIAFRVGPGSVAFLDFKNKKGCLFVSDWGLKVFNVDTRPTICLIYSIILERKQGLLFHGTSIKYNNEGYLFLGRSGSGKTTIASLSMDKIVLSDEISIVLPNEKGNFICYDSPWRQLKATKNWYKSVSTIDKVFFIHQNTIVKVRNHDNINKILYLLQNTYQVTYALLIDKIGINNILVNCIMKLN